MTVQPEELTVGSKVQESLYDDVCDRIVETFDVSKNTRFPVHNAIKYSGLMDFDLLKKVSRMHEKIELVFEKALAETEKQLGGRVTFHGEAPKVGLARAGCIDTKTTDSQILGREPSDDFSDTFRGLNLSEMLSGDSAK